MFNNGRKVVAKININIRLSGPGVRVTPPAQTDHESCDDGSPDNAGDPDGDRILLRAILGKVEDIQQQNDALSEKINFWKRMN